MIQIREIVSEDLAACAALLIDAYNCPPWNNHWTIDSASRYLLEFMIAERFRGFLLMEDGTPSGAAFGHSKAWWTGDEFFIDEFFIAPSCQHRGLGQALMAKIKEYVHLIGLNGITLLTDRHMPAREFYGKNGFKEAEHVVFLYQELSH